jgi:hypothetical protein
MLKTKMSKTLSVGERYLELIRIYEPLESSANTQLASIHPPILVLVTTLLLMFIAAFGMMLIPFLKHFFSKCRDSSGFRILEMLERFSKNPGWVIVYWSYIYIP